MPSCRAEPPWSRRRLDVEDEQVLGGRGEELGAAASPDHEGVLDPDAATPGQVDAGFDGNSHAVGQCTRCGVPQCRRLVDLQSDTMTGAVPETFLVSGVVDDGTAGGVDG